MWQAGDRILARRPPEAYWYPGTIRHVDGHRYYIIFDDGEDGFTTMSEMTRCQFEEGNHVQVYQAATENYLSARVVGPVFEPCPGAEEETLRIRYLNREERTVPLSKIRIHPEIWKQLDLQPEEVANWQWSLCDRVLACWFDLDWYPGIVLKALPDRLHILFDSGAQAMLPLVRVRPFHLAAGERVMCRRKGGRDFYSGQTIAIDGEKIHVLYDDGKQETTSARLLRLRRDEWFPANPGLNVKVGSRVLAQWYDLFWYPGTILAIDGKRLHVANDNGEQGLVTPDQIEPLNITVGTKVFCRRRNEQTYLPGDVTEKEGDRIRVAFEEGGEEWTSMRRLRVEK